MKHIGREIISLEDKSDVASIDLLDQMAEGRLWKNEMYQLRNHMA